MRLPFILAALLAAGAAGAQDTKPFEFAPANDPRGTLGQSATCAFADLKLPGRFLVHAAGAYSGRKLQYQIDQSGNGATQIDVAVNQPSQPVVLMLGAYEPTVWNIGWSERTRIVAVVVSGYHRQVVAGLPKKTPLLISTHDNRGPCGYFYVSNDSLDKLNPLARQLFGKPVDMVFPAAQGTVVVGDAITPGTKLITSPEVPPEAYRDKNAPLAGEAGLEEGVRKGLLRRATRQDADQWAELLQQAQPRDVPPVAGQGVPRARAPSLRRAYVVLKEFTYPAGLYGAHSATFFIAKGAPRPSGNPGHSEVYDFNDGSCSGPGCPQR